MLPRDAPAAPLDLRVPTICHFTEILLLWTMPRRTTPARFGKFIAVENRKLDSIDMRILAELQANGRITNVELSRRARITAPPCLRRMRALEKAGFVQGYHADLNGKAL